MQITHQKAIHDSSLCHALGCGNTCYSQQAQLALSVA